ncbi:DUF362 domain-containing protein [Chloroflexota bacterium]
MEDKELNLTDEAYEKWADQMNALANGFPRTESGVEIKILKKISPPEEAWLVSQLGHSLESAEDISARIGLPVKEVKQRLETAAHHGTVSVNDSKGFDRYQLIPFIPGLLESSTHSQDQEFALLYEQYMMLRGTQGILGATPPIQRVMPAYQALNTESVLPYEDVRALLLEAKDFWIIDCACRIEQDLIGNRKCDFPVKNCIQFTKEGESSRSFDFNNCGESLERISQEEALAILDEAEEIGLVHTVHNNAKALGYICNCCGCCCVTLRPINEHGINSVLKANYYAEIKPEECTACEICIDRCQIGAISMKEDVAIVDLDQCIGCGLCVTGCSSDAAYLHKKPDAQLVHPPADFSAWEKERLLNRTSRK